MPARAGNAARSGADVNERLDARRLGWIATAVAATVASHLDHLPPWLSPAIAAAVVARLVLHARARPLPSAWIRVPLTFALLAAIVAAYGNVFGREPGSALACGLLALKLLETERARDARVAIAFACFVLMSSLLFTSTLWFSLAVGSVLALQLAALSSLQPGRAAETRSVRASFRVAAQLLLTGMPLALAAFVLLPRLDAPLWGSRGADGVGRTGLSETMAPGQFAKLIQDETPALRVTFTGRTPRPSDLYFRTIVLTDFDGVVWTRRDDLGFGAAHPPPRDPAVAYEVTLEATNQRWLPALDLPFTAPPNARIDAEQLLVARQPVAQPLRYAVQSSPQAQLSTALSARDRDRTLRLPAGFGPRARELAQRWRGELGDDGRIVQTALQLFHSTFTYTLEPAPLARDSVDDFLFGTQEGFCEHYASAFVFLMRAAGIPARVVTGYQGGWEANGYLLVRQSDAHAWAEIWREGAGWVRVDPTSAVSPTRIELGATAANVEANWIGDAWRGLRNQLDVVSRLWTESVVRFDSLRQRGLLTAFGVAEAGRRDLLLGLAALLAGAMLLGTAWAMRGTRDRHGDALDRAWSRLRARLARAGIESRAQEGPIDLLARVRASDASLAAGLAPLVHEYVALRYAHATPPALRVDVLAAQVRRVVLPRRVRTATKRHSAASS